MNPKILTQEVSVKKNNVFLNKRGRGDRILKRPKHYNPIIFRLTISNVKKNAPESKGNKQSPKNYNLK